MNSKDPPEFIHELWLIYSQLKDAESDSEKRLDLLEDSRFQLGKVINRLYRLFDLFYPNMERDNTELAPGSPDRQP